MAITSITVTELAYNTLATFPTAAAVAADTDYGNAYYAKVPVGSSSKLLIYITNTHASTAKDIGILAGTAYGSNGEAISLTDLDAGGVKIITVESAKYARGGYIIVSGESADIEVAAVQLP